MKTFALVVLSVILSVTASPLGDRTVFRRHKGTPLSRRYILESRQDAPAACAALPSATTSSPDASSTDLPSVDPTTGDNSTVTADPDLGSNSTTIANSTSTDNSTATTNSTATRRFWARQHGFSHGSGFSDSISEHTSVSVSFEETVSTFVETWEDLCLESGGDIFTNDPCVNLGGSFGIDALSEYADPCDQQDLADSMITFAKSDGIRNRDALISYAVSFRKHARHSVEILGTIPSSLFCLKDSINPELDGIYNAQIDGANPGLFGSPSSSLVPFGSSGTCPYSMTADVSSCGCVDSDGTDASDSSDSTDDSDCSDCTDGTDDSDDDSSTDSTDGTDDSGDDSTDSTDGTDDSDSDSTDSTDASSTDSADASAATDATSTDTADATVTPPPDATGPNFQPTDISGNVNDPSGRRRR